MWSCVDEREGRSKEVREEVVSRDSPRVPETLMKRLTVTERKAREENGCKVVAYRDCYNITSTPISDRPL